MMVIQEITRVTVTCTVDGHVVSSADLMFAIINSSEMD